MLAAGAGRVSGVRILTITGRNRSIDSATVPENLSEDGVVTDAAFLAAAEGMSIASDSADDTALTGSGAWFVLVQGLDAAGNEIEEVVALAGLTPVPLTLEYLRVNLMVVVGSDPTSRTNAGTITLTSTTTATPMRRIAPTEVLDHTFMYTVPTGKYMSLGNFFITLHTANNANTDNSVAGISARFSLPNYGPFIKFATWSIPSRGATEVLWPNPHPATFPGGTDMVYSVDSVSPGGAQDVSAAINVYLVSDWQAIL